MAHLIHSSNSLKKQTEMVLFGVAESDDTVRNRLIGLVVVGQCFEIG